MRIANDLPTVHQLKQFNSVQQNIFFSKADLNLVSEKVKQDSINKKNVIDLLSRKKININEIKHLGEGTNSSSFVFTSEKKQFVIVLNNNKSFPAIRFYKDHVVNQILTSSNIANESILYLSIKKFPEYKISRYYEGESFYDLYSKKMLSKSDFKNLAALLKKIHKIKARGFGSLNVENLSKGQIQGTHLSWTSYLTFNLDIHLEYLTNKKLINKNQLSKITKITDKFINKSFKVKPKLLHGDLANHNIFRADNRKKNVFLIDWEDAIAGDYIYDLSFYGTGSIIDKFWIKFLLNEYFGKNELGRNIKYRYWYYYLRISIFKTVIRSKLDYNNGINEKYFSERINYSLKEISYLS